METVRRYALTRLEVGLDRLIGDSQISTRRLWIGVVELEDGAGRVGTGFFHSVREPLPSLGELEARFEAEVAGRLIGESPFRWTNRLERPRGGNIAASPFHPSLDQAMWDLQAQALDLPLHVLLGGSRHRVRAYASGLEFHLDDDEVAAFYRAAAADGFSAFKVKVGHDDLGRDLDRLRLVRDVVGPEPQLMADANEAWSPKEAIRRLHAFRDAGISLLWIEDPCLRDDFDGLRKISDAVPFTLVNGGEYLDVSGKRQLIERRAVDLVNIHGSIGDAMRIGWLAAEHGLPVTVGNTDFEIGVHVAAALPEVDWLEYSFLSYNHLVEEPIEFCDGWAIPPDRPGHGLRLSDTARREFAAPS